MNKQIPPLLSDLLNARSPSGYEQEAQSVLDAYLEPFVDTYEKDALGNRFASLKGQGGGPRLMLAGHMDELGFIITHINKEGFLYFDFIGGHDKGIVPGRRICILTSSGVLKGVIGKRAIHLLDEKERKEVPKRHQMWIDIGAASKEDALSQVQIGDPVVYDQSFERIGSHFLSARAADDKAGCFVVCEALKRLKEIPDLIAEVVGVATTQEEVGVRGADVAANRVNPDIALAIDVAHATDHPECDARKHGEFGLSKGPIITRGANVNPFVLDRLLACAKAEKIPYQLEADPRPTGTDARSIQVSGRGVATGVICIPLRYMHTPIELIDLRDVEHTIQLVVAFAKSLKKNETGVF